MINFKSPKIHIGKDQSQYKGHRKIGKLPILDPALYFKGMAPQNRSAIMWWPTCTHVPEGYKIGPYRAKMTFEKIHFPNTKTVTINRRRLKWMYYIPTSTPPGGRGKIYSFRSSPRFDLLTIQWKFLYKTRYLLFMADKCFFWSPGYQDFVNQPYHLHPSFSFMPRVVMAERAYTHAEGHKRGLRIEWEICFY